MWKKTPFISALTAIMLFIILESVSFMMITNEGIFQQAKIAGLTLRLKTALSSLTLDIEQYLKLRSVNELLHTENLRLLKENERYKALFTSLDTTSVDKSLTSDFSFISAKIIANSTNKLHNFIILNKGKAHGVKRDMGVISSGGIVGIVTAVSTNYSHVISYLNLNQSVSAKIGATGVFGPMVWEGRGIDYATLKEIPIHKEFTIGDTVFTSGFSSIYPPDIPLGTVRKSSEKGGSYHEIQVKLFQDFSSLYNVSIVVNNKKEELDNLTKK